MPPKRKASASSPATPSTTKMDSSPLPPKRLRGSIPDSAETNELLPSTPATPGAGSAETTQGVKKAAGRKRKATATVDDDGANAEPAPKKKKAAAAAAPKKKAATKKTTAKTPKIVVEDLASERDSAAKIKLEQARQDLHPLTRAVKHKIETVEAFLESHSTPLLAREEEGSNIAIVDELDLLAALIILQVDRQLDSLWTGVSLDDAGEMIVAKLEAGKLSVDFDRACEMEKTVQEKLANRGTGLEEVNLVEVEVEMLVAKRKKLVEDLEPAAGFRVYDECEEAEAGDVESEHEEHV